MVELLNCAECGELIKPEDEIILGEVPFHRACSGKWCEKFIEALGEIKDDSLFYY